MDKTSKGSRSTSYPSLTLEDALKRLNDLKVAIGVKGQFTRGAIVKAIGYSSVSGASARAVAALVQYGLLDRDKDTYMLSRIGAKYLMPTQEGEDIDAVQTAALKPKLFSQLFDAYEGQALPKQLNNILTLKYGIQNKAAPSVVKIIESSFKFAGLIDNNGVLSSPDGAIARTEIAVSQDLPTSDSPTALSSMIGSDLPGGNRGVIKQNVIASGPGWALTVVFEKSRQFTPKLSVEIRTLMNSAEDLSYALYDLDTSLDEKDND